MKIFLQQLKFDSKRIVFRNQSYIFFTILLPLFFYVLYTKIFNTGPTTQVLTYAKTFLGSMAVYSFLINAIFGLAQLLKSDKDHKYLIWLYLMPKGYLSYYFSISLIMVIINILSLGILGLCAFLINGISFTIQQWLFLIGGLMLAQIPFLLLGYAVSFIKKRETLSIVSNLITFPLAIVSGLWWPLSVLPNWAQSIGKIMPTYFANQWFNQIMFNQPFVWKNFYGIMFWILINIVLIQIVRFFVKKQGIFLQNDE